MKKLLDHAEAFSAILALITHPSKSSFLAPRTWRRMLSIKQGFWQL
jgi:hypothetical protein